MLVNHTIDDSDGGSSLTYSPSNAWASGTNCSYCNIYPYGETHPGPGAPVDTTQVFNRTWHDSTSSKSPSTISVNFVGQAVFVFNLIANAVHGTITLTNLTFTLDDDVVGTYTHKADPSAPIFVYNVPVYVNQSIPYGSHTLLISTSGTQRSLVLFDYIIYTADDSATPSPLSAVNEAAPPSVQPTLITTSSKAIETTTNPPSPSSSPSSPSSSSPSSRSPPSLSSSPSSFTSSSEWSESSESSSSWSSSAFSSSPSFSTSSPILSGEQPTIYCGSPTLIMTSLANSRAGLALYEAHANSAVSPSLIGGIAGGLASGLILVVILVVVVRVQKRRRTVRNGRTLGSSTTTLDAGSHIDTSRPEPAFSRCKSDSPSPRFFSTSDSFSIEAMRTGSLLSEHPPSDTYYDTVPSLIHPQIRGSNWEDRTDVDHEDTARSSSVGRPLPDNDTGTERAPAESTLRAQVRMLREELRRWRAVRETDEFLVDSEPPPRYGE